MRKIGGKCNDVEVQSLCHKCAELQTCIFYSYKMALNFPEITLLGEIGVSIQGFIQALLT